MAHRRFERKDRFYLKAKKEGYPARSAYKLLELDNRLGILRAGRRIIDLGCAPGGWLKAAEERLKGKGTLVGIDLLPLAFTPELRTRFIQGDFLDQKNQARIKELLGGPADWVICDLSPDLSGIRFRDEYLSFELSTKAAAFAREVLRPGGGFLFKTFPGMETAELRRALKESFAKIRTIIPEATRRSSAEVYIACTGFLPEDA